MHSYALLASLTSHASRSLPGPVFSLLLRNDLLLLLRGAPLGREAVVIAYLVLYHLHIVAATRIYPLLSQLELVIIRIVASVPIVLCSHTPHIICSDSIVSLLLHLLIQFVEC